MEKYIDELELKLTTANLRINSLCNTLDDTIKTAKYHEQCAEQRQIQLLEAQATIDTHNELVERMQCCGNCKHWRVILSEGRCFVSNPEAWRYDKSIPYAEGSSKCDRWEMMK